MTGRPALTTIRVCIKFQSQKSLIKPWLQEFFRHLQQISMLSLFKLVQVEFKVEADIDIGLYDEQKCAS